MDAWIQASLQSLLDRPLAGVFGVLGLAHLLSWPLVHGRRAILAMQFGMAASYGAHYCLLEAWTGAGLTALGASQTAFSLWAIRHPRRRTAMLAFLPLVAGVVWLTWGGIASMFAGGALAITMLGRLQHDEVRMRIVLLAAAPFGMAYDVLIGSAPALAGGIASASIGIMVLTRKIRCCMRRRVAPRAAPCSAFRSRRRLIAALGLRRPVGAASIQTRPSGRAVAVEAATA
jgi:hypothetical protein